MKKVLIISTHFAPDAHVGAKRTTKFCKYLPHHGWQPIVLTSAISDYHRLDETLMDQLPENLEIHRVKRWRFFKRLDYTLFTTSISWLLPAFFMAWRILKRQKVDIIMSTAPSYEAHVTGLLIKLATGKKWICDNRDLWIFAYLYNPHYKIILRADRWLVRLIMKKAELIIFISHSLKNKYKNLSKRLINSKSAVIYNGFDPDDFVKVPLQNIIIKKKFIITYLGTWGTGRSPETFLLAVKNLVENKRDIKGNLNIQFIGEFKYDPELLLRIKQIIEDYQLGEVINLIQFMSYRKSLEGLLHSDMLLLFLPYLQVDYTPAKLYEYLYARKPILAIVPSEGETAQIIKETRTGVVISPIDISAIEETIRNAYERFLRGKLQINPNKSEIAKYDRRRQTEMLAGIFNRLMEHNSN